MLLAMLAFASCGKETEMTKMISADRVKFTGNNSDLFEIGADSVTVKLIPVGVGGDEWEVRAILPISNTTPWSKIPGSDQSRASFIYGVSIYPKYLDRNDSELDLSVQMDSQDLGSVLKSDENITKEVAITEYSFGDKSYKKQKAYFDMIEGAKLTIDLSWASHGSSSSSSSSTVTSSSNANWDKLLDEYEKCVNECVKLLKKEDNGEWVSEDKIDALLDKADELEKKLDKGLDKMSDAQYERYSKLDDKLMDALL